MLPLKKQTLAFSHSVSSFLSPPFLPLSLSPFSSSLPAFYSGISLPPLSSIFPITFSLFSFQRSCRDKILNMCEHFSGLLKIISRLITTFLKTKNDVRTQSFVNSTIISLVKRQSIDQKLGVPGHPSSLTEIPAHPAFLAKHLNLSPALRLLPFSEDGNEPQEVYSYLTFQIVSGPRVTL